MPITIGNGIDIGNGITITSGAGPINTIDLDVIAAYLRPYLTVVSTSGGLRNPNFYEYQTNGDERAVVDSTNMLEPGNYTTAALLSNQNWFATTSIPNPPSMSYANTSTTTMDTNFDYISLGWEFYTNPTYVNKLPLTLLGTRRGDGNPTGFQKAGNLGADGQGTLGVGDLYTGQVYNGFTTYAYYRQAYGYLNIPAVCDLYILLGHSSWNSVFGTVEGTYQSGTEYQGAQFRTYGSGTQNILAITTLLSLPGNASPRNIAEADMQQIVQNYTYLIGQALGI